MSLESRKEPLLSLWPQAAAAATVTLLSVNIGLATGWTSPYLAQFTKEGSYLYLTSTEASWVASLLPLGRFIGAIVGSVCVEYLGSKSSLFITGIPLLVGWICVIFANSAIWLYIYRTLSGITMGMIFSCYPLFIGEISSPRIRGSLITIVVNGLPLGTFFGNVMGPRMMTRTFGIISFFVSLAYIVLFPFLPKSPYYLVRCNELAEAEKSIRFYHRKSNFAEELTKVKNFVHQSEALTFRAKLSLLHQPQYRKAFFIIISLYIYLQLSGLTPIIYYMEIILARAQVTAIEPSTVVFIVHFIAILIGWVATVQIERQGRKKLLAISSAATGLSSLMMAMHFLLLTYGYDPTKLQYLPIIAMICFKMVAYGLTPVPSTMLGELFPVSLKSIAGFAGSMTSATFAFIMSKSYQPLVEMVTEQYVFWMYATFMATCFMYALLCIPETKGKTLMEIQELLSNETQRANQKENL